MAVAKKTTAKKTVAKKSSPAPAKKTAAPTTRAPRKSASTKPPVAPVVDNDADEVSADAMDALAQQFITMIGLGVFDFTWTALNEAIDKRAERIEVILNEEQKAKRAAKKTEPKTTVKNTEGALPTPKKPATASKFDPEVGVVYAVAEGHPLHGSKVKFLGYFKGDDAKSKAEITTEIPGNPVGKKVVLPTDSLVKPAARRARRAK